MLWGRDAEITPISLKGFVVQLTRGETNGRPLETGNQGADWIRPFAGVHNGHSLA
jgi:hypothetical protein